MSEPKFIHLRVHSDFSMIDGLSKVPSLVKKVAESGMPAMALTDFTNLCGLVKYYLDPVEFLFLLTRFPLTGFQQFPFP